MKSSKKIVRQIPRFETSTSQKACGGSLSLGVRRKRRPLSCKAPLHLVLKSDFAYGRRSLLGHRPLVDNVIQKFSKRFKISIYEKAIVSNHIHILIRGKSRIDLQNFFRVVAGQIAQEILRKYPIQKWERQERDGALKKREKVNKFWQTRIYTRVMSWGREFINVKKYVIQNAKEALGLVPYKTSKEYLHQT